MGLGTMGYPMAGHLHRNGFDTRVFNRTSSVKLAWVKEYGGAACDGVAEFAQTCDVIMTCLGNDDDVHACYLGEQGLLPHARPGTLLVDHTTTSAQLAKQLQQAAHERQLEFIDAPVSGGQAGAVAGQLTVMAGGEEKAFNRALPFLQAYGKRISYLGGSGNGQLCKMVNQICIAGVLQGLAEGLAFAERAELDTDTVLQAISAGAAGSWQMENRWQTMHQRKFDFGFAVDWMRKDLAFCRAEAVAMGLELTCVEAVDERYALLQAKGENRSDTSVLVKQFDPT